MQPSLHPSCAIILEDEDQFKASQATIVSFILVKSVNFCKNDLSL